MIPKIFEGGDAVIVAGGPSLRGFDFKRLEGLPVIAINRAHEFLPHATLLWWTDAKYWRRSNESLLAHGARWKATGNLEYRMQELPRTIEQYLFTGPTGFDENHEHLRHGWNSAYAATHLAAHLGARRIILLGVDMRHDGAPTGRNFHSGYGTAVQPDDTLELWKTSFSTLAPIMAEKGIEVINGSAESALTVWPRMSPGDALSLLDRQPVHG